MFTIQQAMAASTKDRPPQVGTQADGLHFWLPGQSENEHALSLTLISLFPLAFHKSRGQVRDLVEGALIFARSSQ